MANKNAVHEQHIVAAIELAAKARANGNHPFGALLVHNGNVILTAQNTVSTKNNPTHHAEMRLVDNAWNSGISADVIKESTLYTSCEPCPMCTGAIFWSGIRRVVYSLPALRLGEIANDKFCGPCTDLFDKADDKTEVIGPILPEQGESVHSSFWTALASGAN